LRDVFCPVLEFREKKRTFMKIEKGNMDFFLILTVPIYKINSAALFNTLDESSTHIPHRTWGAAHLRSHNREPSPTYDFFLFLRGVQAQPRPI
jgi:hypothetical protein